MKKITILLFACLTSSLVLAQESAKVYFIRNTGFRGSATAFNAFINDDFVCRLNSNRYSIHEVKPGQHNFQVQFGGKKSNRKAEKININVEAGKTYYIQMTMKTGILLNNLYCVEVTESTALSLMEGLKEDKNCGELRTSQSI